MKYVFEYDEINCCYECPLFYDFIYCELEPLHDLAGHTHNEYTDYDDNKRPEWCQLKEANELDKLEKYYQSLLDTLNGDGISAFLTADGKWHISK